MKIYKYTYYILFLLWQKKKDEPENAKINAILTITFAMYLNILSTPLIALAFLKKDLVVMPELKSKVIIVLLLIMVGIINYTFLAKKDKHNKIIKKFAQERSNQLNFSKFLVFVYLAISFGLPLYIFLFTVP
ncbi:hypothetical protein [Marinifilum sp.]|uniref:hypothetical protein n=1 Tax=Marinifilum sp. TaxID=2033137 RepID=UPI003BA85810